MAPIARSIRRPRVYPIVGTVVLTILLLGILLLGIGLATVPRAHAQERTQEDVPKQYALSNYDVTLALRSDGAVDIRETIELDVQRGSFSTMYRDVAVGMLDSLTNVSVTSPDTRVDSLHVSTDDGVIDWAFPERRSPATFEIAYRAHGGLRTEDGENILKWAAIGSGWDVPIRDVDVRVDLPASLSIPRDGLSMSPSDEATLGAAGGGWEVSFRREALDAGQGYSVRLAFPERIEAKERFTGLDVLQGLLVFALIFSLFAGRRLFGRPSDPDVEPRHRTPNVSLPEAARLLSDARSGLMHSAMLLDLARRGHLSLQAETTSSWTGDSTTVHLDLHPDRMNLDAFERDFVDALSDCETLKDVATDLDDVRSKQRTEIRKRLVQFGYLTDRTPEYRRYVAITLLALCGTFAAFLGGIVWHWMPAAYVVPFFMATSLGTALFVDPRFPRTDTGRTKRAEIQGYLETLRTEIETLRDDDPAAAARRLLDALPWLVLDPKVTKKWMTETEKTLQASGHAHVLPDWIQHTTSNGEALDIAVLATIVATSGSATSPSSAGTAGGIAGAGAAGAAGGGGGGAG